MPFEGILGHSRNREILLKALKRRQLSHAYLFHGPEGVGKRTVAREFARLIMCATKTGCGACRSCRFFASAFHIPPDLKYIHNIASPLWFARHDLLTYINAADGSDAAEDDTPKSKPNLRDRLTSQRLLEIYADLEKSQFLRLPPARAARADVWDGVIRQAAVAFEQESTPCASPDYFQKRLDALSTKDFTVREVAQALYSDIGVETYNKTIKIDLIRRAVQQSISIKPYLAPFKVYILDDAETMTEEAQNCLLKTLEEPPNHSIMILITARPEHLLPTIRSRCRQLAFGHLTDADLSAILEGKFGFSSERAHLVSIIAGGSLNRALSEDWTDYFARRNLLLDSLPLLTIAHPAHIFIFGDRLIGSDDESPKVLTGLEILKNWCHDLMMMKAGLPDNLIYQDLLDQYRQQERDYSDRFVNQFHKTLKKIFQAIDRRVNPQLAIEAELFKFLRNQDPNSD